MEKLMFSIDTSKKFCKETELFYNDTNAFTGERDPRL